LLSYLFCSHKYHKIENYFILELVKIFYCHFTKNYCNFYPKNCHKALKNMGLGSGIRDPRPRIRDPEKTFLIPDPGVKNSPDPGSGSATLIFTDTRISVKVWSRRWMVQQLHPKYKRECRPWAIPAVLKMPQILPIKRNDWR
jgi:hypothetical protein